MNSNVEVGSQSNSMTFYWLAILLVFFVSFLIYLALPSQQYDRDVLYELARINNFNRWSSDPAHMFYVIMGIPIYKLWLSLGYIGDALRAMQVFNAFCGAGAITVFAIILRKINTQTIVLILVTFMIAFSYAFWTHTADAFFIIPAAFLSLVALLCAIKLSSQGQSRWWTFAIGLAFSLSFSILCYQTNLLIIPALMAASLREDRKWGHWLKQWLMIMMLVCIMAGSVWIYQGIYLAKVSDAKQLVSWFFAGHGGISRGLWRREGMPLVSTTIIAWLATIFPIYEGFRLRELLEQEQLYMVRIGLRFALSLFVGLVTLALYRLIRVGRKYQRILKPNLWLACCLWFCIPGIAVLWFDRAEVKLWLIPMFSLWIILAALINCDLKERAAKSAVRKTVLGFLLAAFLTISLSNFLLAVWPNYRYPSVEIQKAKQAIPHLTAKDLLISSSFDWTSYVRYFCPECYVVNVLGIAQRYPKEEEGQVLEVLLRKISTTCSRGGRVYVVEYMGVPDSPIWRRWITPYTGLTPDYLAAFEKRRVWKVENETVWELKPRESCI